MESTCLDTNLLAYSGTSQLQRMLDALAATYAQVDERTATDLILFAKNYAAYLNYYDATDNISGEWQPFMSMDAAVIIADVAEWQTQNFIPFVEKIKQNLQAETDSNHAKELFKTLFDLVFTLATKLDRDLKNLTSDISFKDYVSVAIISNLALPLNALWQYYSDFKTNNVIDESADYVDIDMPVDDVIFSQYFQIGNLSNEWQIATFTALDITLGDAADIVPNINIIITHNLFTGALQSFLNGVIKIVSDAPSYLNDVLQKYSLHQPHYALYLSFVRLFQFAQKKLNNYTQNHLDFYYKTVLKLSNAAAKPDFVHLLFELQKNVPDHILKKGTAFKAGKDANNKDLFYTLTDDVVLHDASVQSLKSLYLKRNNPPALYASPVANSADGQGTKITSADKSWFTFGDLSNNDFKVNGFANIGFAIASNMLFLNEATRTVTITFQCNKMIDAAKITAALSGKCRMQFTGKKNWFDPFSFNTGSIVTCTIINSTSFSLSITIPGNAPAVIPYSSKIHGGNFTHALPMLQLQLTDYAGYADIKTLDISSIKIKVEVGTDNNDGVKDIILQNDDGRVNPAKSFKLFGEFPDKTSSLIIGSKEIFQKKLDSLTINLTWQPDSEVATRSSGASSASASQTKQVVESRANQFIGLQKTESASDLLTEITVQSNQKGSTQIIIEAEPPEIDYLFGGKWTTLTGGTVPLISARPSSISVPFSDNTVSPATTDFTPNEDYKASSVDGFLKIQLNDNSFNLPIYLYKVRQSVAETSVKITTVPNVSATYTMDPPAASPVPNAPTALSLDIHYTASKVFSLNTASKQFSPNTASKKISLTASKDTSLNKSDAFLDRTDFFYHIEPFGYREMHGSITNDKLTLLPVFNLDDSIVSAGATADSDGGELWIGLTNAAASETFSILFQVADGTSNPLQPMTTVSWYYLSANNWKSFTFLEVTDQTNNLTRSGIVILNIPTGVIAANTRADSSLLWVKAVVGRRTDAICKLVTVSTNAAKATFLQDVSKNIVFTKKLESNIISKPAVADAALKKINQPYPSFDGRISETDKQFYVRVSERLRHKQRALAMWDYERLILQNYPQIYKVKCINHSGFITGTYCETLPGHVTIVTIPDLINNTTANPLRPYTSIGLLTEIQQYLEKIDSKFVRLRVINPQFEEVQFQFTVTYMPDHDATVFTNQLNTDIEQFLTPWAFDAGRDIDFGATIEKSVVLNFIEERDYVDYVICFQMNQIIRDDMGNIRQTLTDVEKAVPSTARSILVSYNDGITRHRINEQTQCDCNA